MIVKQNRYPKSNRLNMAKLEYSPKGYEQDLKKIDYFAFGDSFVNMFLHAENTFYIKLKGKSIKGLAKIDKEERISISKWIKAIPKNVTLVFNFGQVDLNFIRYYKLTREETYPQETFKEYVDWISSFQRKCIVLGIFASPISSQNIVETLLKYGALQNAQPDNQKILKEHEKTQDVRKMWNGLIEKACQKNQSIRFINLFEHHKPIDVKFLDQNPKTIHLRYLPSIMQLAIHLTDIRIDMKKSLEIQQEYVHEKTKRYEQNLQILEEQNANESLESEETSQSRKSSKDVFDQTTEYASEHIDNQSDNFERGDKLSDEEYLGSKEYLEDKEENERFIDLLGIQGIQNPQKLFDKIRKPNNLELLLKLADRIVQVGIFWMSNQRFDCCMVNFYMVNSLTLIKDISEVQEEIESDEISFQKIIRSKLQENFEKNLRSNDKIRVIQDVITLIVYFFHDQKTFQLTIVPEKLIFMVLKQILLSVFRRIVSSNPEENDGVVADFNCFYKLKYNFTQRMNEIFQKQNLKKKINEQEFYSKFLELLLCKNLDKQKLEEKAQQLDYLLNEEYPYAIYSPKISEELLKIFGIELDFYQFRKSLKISQKYLVASQQNTINLMKQRVSKMRQQLTKSLTKIDLESNDKKKSIEDDICCKCGCLKDILTASKSEKEKKEQEKKQHRR